MGSRNIAPRIKQHRPNRSQTRVRSTAINTSVRPRTVCICVYIGVDGESVRENNENGVCVFPVLQLKCRGSLFIVRPRHQHTVQIHLSRFNESVSVRHSDQIHLSRFNESVSVKHSDQIHLSRFNESVSVRHSDQIHLSRFNESVSVRYTDQIHLSRFNESVSTRYTAQIHLSRLNESHSHFKLFQATVFNSISQWISLRKCPGNYIKNILKNML